MGYTGDYTIFQRSVSEFVATWMFIFLLLAVLTNKLLPGTKGHNISFGWIAFGIGIACFLPVQFFGYISSQLNPAMSLANAIAGTIDWKDILPLATAQFLGAFLGAVTNWIFYLPHYSTRPEPPPKKETDRLLRPTDDIGRSSLAYASYTPKPHKVKPYSLGVRAFKNHLYGRIYGEEAILGHNAILGRMGKARRRSIDPSDLHDRLERIHGSANNNNNYRRTSSEKKTKNNKKKKNGGKTEPISFAMSPAKSVTWAESSDNSDKDDSKTPLLSKKNMAGGSTEVEEVKLQIEPINSPDATLKKENVSQLSLLALQEYESRHGIINDDGTTEFYEPCRPASMCEENPVEEDDVKMASAPINDGRVILFQNAPSLKRNSLGKRNKPVFANARKSMIKYENEKKEAEAEKLKKASILADQHIKLATFATRPAVYSPISNIIAEILGTMILTSGILFLNQRGDMIWEGDKEVYLHGLKSFWVGILVNSLVLSLGGIGVAINPARDLGPRVAHWILPISGKGSSEWYYGWIPVLGTFLGGAAGGIFYNLCDMLNHSTVYEGYYSAAINQLILNQATEL